MCRCSHACVTWSRLPPPPWSEVILRSATSCMQCNRTGRACCCVSARRLGPTSCGDHFVPACAVPTCKGWLTVRHGKEKAMVQACNRYLPTRSRRSGDWEARCKFKRRVRRLGATQAGAGVKTQQLSIFTVSRATAWCACGIWARDHTRKPCLGACWKSCHRVQCVPS